MLTSLWFYLGNLAGISEDDIKQLITSMQVLEIVASNLQESLTERVGIGFLLMILKSHSQLPKKLFYLLQWKPFKDLKMMKNVFYFMLKAYFLPTPTGPVPPQANPSPGLIVCPHPPSGRTNSKTLFPPIPPPLDTLTTALACILSLILNHVARQIERISR